MRKNLFILLLSLLTATWAIGQKAPESEHPKEKGGAITATDLTGFKNKPVVQNTPPKGALLNESFSGTEFPPPGWRVINYGSIDLTWERFTGAGSYTPITAPASVVIPYTPVEKHEDWLITPPLLPKSGSSTISLQGKQTSTYWRDKQSYRVRISTTGNDTADFNIILATTTPYDDTPSTYEYSLNDYIGDTIYVAFQTISSAGRYMLILDDFTGPEVYIPPTDLEVTGGNIDYRLIPKCQLSNATTLKAIVKNKGQLLESNVNINMSVKNANGVTIQSSTGVLNSGLDYYQTQTVSGSATVNLSNLDVGNYKYYYYANYIDDNNISDNTDTANFTVTNDIYARDAGEFTATGFGYTQSSTFGNLFEVVNAARITGVQFVWASTLPEDIGKYKLALYKVDNTEDRNVIGGAPIFITNEYQRNQSQAGQTMNFLVRPTLIDPGYYVLAIIQNSSKNILIARDKKADGFALLADYYYGPTKFNSRANIKGNLSLRMDFAPRRIISFEMKKGETPTAISGATVTFKQGETVIGTATSNAAGVAEIYALDGEYTYSVTAIGYEPKSNLPLEINDDATIIVKMQEAPPTLEVTPTPFTFAETQITALSVPQTFTLRNIGTGTVTINPSDIVITGDNADQFVLTTIGSVATLATGEVATFTVRFNPTTVGEKTATIVVNSDAGQKSVPIEGTAHDLTVTNFPFIESFNNETFPPLGWSNVGIGDKEWERVTTGEIPTCSPTGAAMLRYNCYKIPADKQAMLATRRLDIGTGTYSVGFKMYRDAEYNSADKVDVYVNTQPNTTDGTPHLLGTIHRSIYRSPNVTKIGWYDYQFNIPEYYIQNPSYIVLLATSKAGPNIFVDEFVVKEAHTVTLETNPPEQGTVSGGGIYFKGTEINISATANQGYRFINWTDSNGDVVSTTQTFKYTVGDSSVTLTANFAAYYDIAFNVTDQSATALSGVTIAYTGTLTGEPHAGKTLEGTATTDSDGKDTLLLPNGNYVITLTKADYYTATRNITVSSSAQSIDVTMNIMPLVTINVKDTSNNPINGAAINLDGVPAFTTDASGVATKRLDTGAYTGTVYKIGYFEVDIDFTLTTDTTINCTLTQAPPTFAYTLDWSEGAVFNKTPINVGSHEMTFKFTNIGTGPLNIAFKDFSIVGGGPFTLPSNYSTLYTTLNTGQESQVKVTFVPTEAGVFTSQLVYPNNGDTIIIQLSGTAYQAQSTPFIEDFESGSFGTNKWFAVNENRVNKWYVGTAENDNENKSAIISNDGGITNAYTMTGYQCVHIYIDIDIPSGNELGDVKLFFDWKGLGQTYNTTRYDFMSVRFIDPSIQITPDVWNGLPAGQSVGNFNGKDTWQKHIYNIPTALFGTTKRLVFTWENNNDGKGFNPPAAFDNIVLMKPVKVASVTAGNDIEVPYGTAFSDLQLPQKLMVTFNEPFFGESTKELSIIWNNNPPFDGTVLGERQITGTIQLPNGVVNNDSILATQKVTVVKATPVVTTWPVAGNEITYGQALSAVTINASGAEASVPGEYTYVDGAIYPTVTAGGYLAQLKFTPSEAGNYNVVYGTMPVTVNKYAIQVTANNITKAFGTEYIFEGNEFSIFPGMLFSDQINTVTLTSDGAADTAAVNEDPGYEITPSNAVGVGLDNYQISYAIGRMTVAVKTLLSYPNIAIANKVYDKTVTATIASFGDVAGIDPNFPNITIDNTNAVAKFTTVGAGTNKRVSVTGLTINGEHASHYAFSNIVGYANITQRQTGVVNAVAQAKAYDGTNAAVITGAELNNIIDGDVVTINNATAGTFAQTTIGTNITVTTNMTIGGLDAANYQLTGQPTLTANITAKELTIGGSFTASAKAHDGTTAAVINPAGLTLVGVIGSETVTLKNVVATFDSSDIGEDKVVSIVSAEIEGEDSGNYTLSLVGAPTAVSRIFQGYELTLLTNPVGGGTVNDVSGMHEAGETITVSTTPAEGYVFHNWTKGEDQISSKTQFVYLMPSENVTLTANFDKLHTVTFTVINGLNNPVVGANIVINSQTLTTDSSGVATITLINGTYPYTISKIEFDGVTGDAVVNGANLPIDITLQSQIFDPHDVTAEVINYNQAKLSWNPSFTDDIESYEDFIIEDIGNYTLVDVDGSPTYESHGIWNNGYTNRGYTGSFIVFNPSATIPPVTASYWQPHGGNKYLACFSAKSPQDGGSGPNNDWLITHQVTATPKTTFSFWAKTGYAGYGYERFTVAISTTGTAPADFTVISTADHAPGKNYVVVDEWTQYTYSLKEYAGQQVYLAINCVSNFSSALMIDDIHIKGPIVSESDALIGYNLYLDSVLKASNVTSTEYTITGIPAGTHAVGVQSIYTSGLSEIVYADSITALPPKYDVTFTVTDSADAPVVGATIVISESDTLTTNASGIATIELLDGTYSYTITKAGFIDYPGSFEVDGADLPINVELTYQEYSLTLVANPVGQGTVNSSVNGNYIMGDTVTVIATPAFEHLFVNWTKDGTVVSANAQFEYVMPPENVTLTANFAPMPRYNVTFSITNDYINPVEGATVVINQDTLITDASGMVTFSLVNGTYTYKISKIGYQTISNSVTVQGKDHTVYPRLLYERYTLTLNKNIENGGTVNATYLNNLHIGSNTTVSAIPAQGYRFIKWTKDGEVISTNAQFAYVMPPSNVTLTAYFELIPTYTATIAIKNAANRPVEGATVTIKQQTLTTNASGIVTIVLPDGTHPYTVTRTGYLDATDSVVVNGADTTFNKTLIYQDYTLTMYVYPMNGGTVNITSGTYHIGDSITLIATPAENYRFVKWTLASAEVSTDSQFVYVMPASNVNLQANFAQLSTFDVTFTVVDSLNRPVQGASVGTASSFSYTNASGQATLALYSGTHHYTISKIGYFDATGNVIVSGADTTIKVTLNKQMHNFKVVANPTEGGSVNSAVNGSYALDDSITVIATPAEGYNFIAWKRGADLVSSHEQFIYVMPNENVTLTAYFSGIPKYTVTFNVKDASNAPIEGATIAINQQTLTTNASGVATIDLENGTYPYTISKDDYIDVTGNASVSGQAVTINATLNLIMSNVTFTVVDTESNPVKYADVVINSRTLRTNYNGIVTISLANGTYPYTISKYGYADATGNVEVDGEDVSVDVTMILADYTLTIVANPAEGGSVNDTVNGTYHYGDNIILVATPADGYRFVNWTENGVEVSTNTTYYYTMLAKNVTLTANFAPISTYNISFQVRNTENKSIKDATITINNQTQTTNYFGEATFSLENGTYTFTISKTGYIDSTGVFKVEGRDYRYVVTLNFVEYNLTLVANPEEGGTVSTASGTYNCHVGEEVTVIATPAEGYNFVNWTKGEDVVSTNAQFVYIMPTEDVTLTANFEVIMQTYTVTFTVKDTANNPLRYATIQIGNHTLRTSNLGTAIIHLTNGTYPYTVTMDYYDDATGDAVVDGEDVSVDVTMHRTKYSLTLVANPAEGGTVNDSVNGNYVPYTYIPVAATPAPGYNFTYWTKGQEVVNTNRMFSYHMPRENVTLTANFELMPTYTVTFTVKDAANVPIEGATVVINQDTLTTDASGITTIELVNGTYSYTISKEGYVDVTGNAVVNEEDLSINATLNLIEYTVTFTVVDAANAPIEGATIAINQQTLTTNASGIATIALVNGEYPYTISKDGYVNATGDAVVNGEDLSISSTLNLIEYTVTFTVVDAANAPIEGATIAINQETLTTNASGIATIELVNGTYSYTISKEGYVDVTGNAVVNEEDLSINATLNLIEYTVTFTVVDAANAPIEGATIAINQQTLTTNASGIATIELVNGTYPYTISKDGYVDVSADAVVNGEDLSINATLNYVKYALTLTANPVEGGTVNDVSGDYRPGTEITVIATPAEGYNFVNWTKGEEVSSTNAEFVYVMPSEDVTLTANFELIPTYTVTFTVNDATNAPIEGATIAINQETLTTNASGIATITLVNGEYPYTVSKAGYADATGNAEVNGTDVSVNVTLTLQAYTLTLIANPVDGGTATTESGTYSYHMGENITVIATPAAGFRFVNWTKDGAELSADAQFVYVMPSENATLTANFASETAHDVTFTVTNNAGSPIEGATVAINQQTLTTNASGIATIALENGTYPYTISKVGYIDVTGDAVVDGEDVAVNVTLPYEMFTLTLVANPANGGTVNNVGGEYQAGAEVTVIATPATGYNFVNWTKGEEVVSISPEFTYTMPSEDVTLTANFEVATTPTYTVTFTVNDAANAPIEGATVAINQETLTTNASGIATIELEDGTYSYTISKAGYIDATGNAEVNGADVSITETLILQTYTLTLIANPVDGGTVSTENGTYSYHMGESVTVTATPAAGFRFVNWTKDGVEVSSNSQFAYTMPNENVTLTANFASETSRDVTFTVTNNTGSPIEGATVAINQQTLTTNASGIATIALENGTYPYTISKVGYIDVTGDAVVDGEDVAVNVTLPYEMFTLTLVANPVEGGTVNNVGGEYQLGAEITIIATPAEGYNFVNWTKGEEVVSISPEFTYTMPAEDVTLTANFEVATTPTYTVTFTVNDAANAPIEDATVAINQQTLTTNASGIATIELEDGTYPYTVSKTGYVNATGDVVVNGADVPVNVTLNHETFTLTLVANPVEGGTVNNVGGEYQLGAEITVIATPATGYNFVNWTKGAEVVSASPEFVYTMPAEDVTLTANFEVATTPTYTVTFTVVDAANAPIENATVAINQQTLTTNASGIATIELENGTYPYTVSKTGYVNATGDVVVNGANVPVNVTLNHETFTLTLVANPANGGTVNNVGGEYQAGAEVTVIATPATGYNFVNWTKGAEVVSTSPEFVYTMPAEDVTLTANFQVASIPTYTVTFTVKDAANTPIQGATVAINQQTLTTNTSGVATITLENGTYPYTVSKAGYINATGNAVVNGANVPVNVTLNHETFTLTLVANPANGGTVNNVGGEYQAGAEVTVIATPATGYNFVNWTKGAEVVSTSPEFVYTMPAEDVTLTANFQVASTPTYTVTFTVKDAANTPIQGATVAINQQTLTTNASGVATITLENGTYPYTVSMAGYIDITGEAVVDGADINVAVTMEQVTFAITFHAVHNGTSLEGVTINIDGEGVLTTDAQGNAVIELANGSYSYTATKEGYNDAEGTFEVTNAAQTITINMTGIEELAEKLVRLYPNPVLSVLTIERNSSDEVVIELYNSSGALVSTTKTDNATTTIDVGMLGSGTHFVRVIGTNYTTIHKFIKR